MWNYDLVEYSRIGFRVVRTFDAARVYSVHSITASVRILSAIRVQGELVNGGFPPNVSGHRTITMQSSLAAVSTRRRKIADVRVPKSLYATKE